MAFCHVVVKAFVMLHRIRFPLVGSQNHITEGNLQKNYHTSDQVSSEF